MSGTCATIVDVASDGSARVRFKETWDGRDFRANGTTIVLVSHSPALVSEFCDRAIWIDHGHLMREGRADRVPGPDAEGKRETLSAAQVLMAVGRGARTKGLGLEALGVSMDRGLVTVGPTMETSVKAIFAVGDMAGRQMLAHKAMAEGVVAAETIAGRSPRSVNYGNVPSCTYCRPQVASIGLSEAAAKTDGREVSVGRFPFTANGKAVALGETEGFLKVVADKRTGEILGVHIVGPEATELIHEFAVGRTLEATLEEIVHTIHAHPTLSEAAFEATLAALGHPIHI